MAINKINVRGIDYELSDIKTVEIKGVVDEDNGYISFETNTDVDYAKGFFVEIYENNNIVKEFHCQAIYHSNQEGLTQNTIFDGSDNYEDYTMIFSYLLCNSAYKLEPINFSFWLEIPYFEEKNININNLKMKVYYIQCNKTSTPVYDEL